MKKDRNYFIAALMGVACCTSLSLQAAPRSTPVTVVNDSASPVPVTGAVTVENDAANPVPVVIQDPVRVNTGINYRYVGTSTTATLPTVGSRGIDELCQANYGQDARMCNTKEFFDTPFVVTGPLGREAWVRPVVEATMQPFREQSPTQVFYLINPGVWVEGQLSGGITCQTWKSSFNGHTGLAIRDIDSARPWVDIRACDFSRDVVCCAPD